MKLKKMIIALVTIVFVAVTLSGCFPFGLLRSAPSSEEIQESSYPLDEDDKDLDADEEDEKTEKPAPTGSVTLSDDIYDYQIQLDDIVYQLPMTYSDFVAYGWTCEEDEDEKLDSNYRSSVTSFSMGELTVYTSIVNFDTSARPMKECYVGKISVDDYQLKKAGARALIPGGFELGVSKSDEVIDKFGTPTDEYDGSSSLSLKYSEDYYQEISLRFDKESGLLNSIEVCNLTKPEDFETGEASDEIPKAVTAYKAPASVSDDFADFTVEFGGDLYQLPAPLSALEKNGWKIKSDGEETISGRGYGWVTLRKDNQEFRVIAQNYSSDATNYLNCFTTTFKASEMENKTPMTISKGITIGMSQANLEKALKGTKFEKDDSSSSYIQYEIEPVGTRTDTYSILVNKESKKVYKIEMDYQPKFDDFAK